MTTVTTMDEFNGLAVGSLVTIGGNSNYFERVDGGWRQNDFTLETEHFEGDILQGRVYLGVKPEAGQLWSDEGAPNWGYTYLLLAPDQDNSEHWQALQIMDGIFYGLRLLRSVPGKIVTEDPPWKAMARSMGNTLLSTQQSSNAYSKALTEERNSRATDRREHENAMRTLRENVQNALHPYMRENNVDPSGPLGVMLTENGMRRPDQVVAVAMKVRISVYVPVPVEALSEHLPEGAQPLDAGQTYLNYTVDITHRVEVEAGRCGCALATRRQVREVLRERDIRLDDFTIMERTCESESCVNRAAASRPF